MYLTRIAGCYSNRRSHSEQACSCIILHTTVRPACVAIALAPGFDCQVRHSDIPVTSTGFFQALRLSFYVQVALLSLHFENFRTGVVVFACTCRYCLRRLALVFVVEALLLLISVAMLPITASLAWLWPTSVKIMPSLYALPQGYAYLFHLIDSCYIAYQRDLTS